MTNIYDQWNLKDSLDPSDIRDLFQVIMIMTHFSEIYIFSYRNDSLFLNVNEILEPQGIKYGKEHLLLKSGL